MNNRNTPLFVIGAYDYLELIVTNVDHEFRPAALRALRYTCRQFMYVTAPLTRYEMRLHRRHRAWFNNFATFHAMPMWTLVTSVRLTSSLNDLERDLRTIGAYLTYVESIYVDLTVDNDGGSSDYLCTLRGLNNLEELKYLRCFGVTGLDDSKTLVLDDVVAMAQWQTPESNALSIDITTKANTRLSRVPSATIANLRLRSSAVTALIDCGTLHNVQLTGFIIAREADVYMPQRGVSEGRLSSLLRGWTNLTTLVMHNTICALSIARAIGNMVYLVQLVWYSDVVAKDWDELPLSPTVPRWSGTSDHDTDPYYDPRRESDIPNSHKAPFVWILDNVVIRLPKLRIMRFGCVYGGIQAIGSGWIDDGELYPLWKIARESDTLRRDCVLGVGDPESDASATRTWPYRVTDGCDPVQPSLGRSVFLPDSMPQHHDDVDSVLVLQ